MIVDHIGFGVRDYQASKTFYSTAMGPLDITLVMEVGPDKGVNDWAAGFGRNGKPELWIGGEGLTDRAIHIAVLAESRAQVDAFHAAAMKAGATDNGKPGLRPHYHPDYYAAFVLDPDGHNIEAVCHKPA